VQATQAGFSVWIKLRKNNCGWSLRSLRTRKQQQNKSGSQKKFHVSMFFYKTKIKIIVSLGYNLNHNLKPTK
jgi:hypothetical protein